MTTPAKHVPVNTVAQLHRTVRAHVAVREGIATHAEKEHVRRQEQGAKMLAEARLKESVEASREKL